MPNYKDAIEREKISKEYTENYKNEVVKGSYALDNDFLRLPKNISDVQPLKLLGLILSKLEYKKDNRDVSGNVIIECSMNEIMKTCGADPKQKNYAYYKGVAKVLIEKSLVDGEIDGEDIFGPVFGPTRAKLSEDGYMKFKINSEFLPYFQMLSSNYTIIQLQETKNLKSKASYFLYMNLLSWTNEPYKEYVRFYTTNQLRALFELSDKDYMRKKGGFNRFEFEKKVVNKAVEEINEKTSLKVEYIKTYVGKEVANYRFSFIYRNDFDIRGRKQGIEVTEISE